jgi:hypothetical protein
LAISSITEVLAAGCWLATRGELCIMLDYGHYFQNEFAPNLLKISIFYDRWNENFSVC